MRLRTLVTSFILAALGCAPELASAQQPGQLTRITPTTGLADSTLFVCSDSTKTLTRACKFSDVQKRLAFKTFDSLVTGNIRMGGTATSLVGGAGNMTVQAGTGASRNLFLQTTTAGGTVTNTIELDSAQHVKIKGSANTCANPNLSMIDSTATGINLVSGVNPAKVVVCIAGTALVQSIGTTQFGHASGTTSAPGIAFSANSSSGFSYTAGDTINTSVNGAVSMGIRGGATPTWFGGAGNLTIQAGTGNSRRLAVQTTTSAGTATEAVHFNEKQQSLFAVGSGGVPSITFAGDTLTGLNRNATNSIGVITAGTTAEQIATSRHRFDNQIQGMGGSVTVPAITMFSSDTVMGFYLLGAGTPATDSIGVAVNGVAQMKIGAGVLLLPALPSEAATKNAMCWDATTKNVTQNAAATCTVSSARFKENIVPVDAAAAWKIVGKSQLHSSTYNERVGGRKAIGIIAEQADSADTRLASRDAKGLITSTNYEEVTSLLLTVVKDQQRQLAFQQKMIDSLGRMVDTLFWKRGSLCNGKACKSEPEIPVHRVLRTKNIRIAPRVEMIRDTSATYTFPRARVVKDSAGVVQVKLLPSREP